MKKLIGIIAAVAMAASVFAVDLSASLKMNGSLFDVTFEDGAKPSAFKLKKPEGRKPWAQTGIDLNVNADKAGATINIGAEAQGMVGYKLWMQPLDMLKITLGDLDYNINKETIDYAGCINSAGSNGFAFDITPPVDGLSFSFLMNPGWGTAWFANEKFNSTAFYAKYAADFGTIGAAWIYSPSLKITHEVFDLIGADSRTATEISNGDTPYLKVDDGKSNTFSVGYNNTFGDVSMFADVAFTMTADSDVKDVLDTSAINLAVDGFVKYGSGDFGIAAYAQYTNYLWLGHLNSKYDMDLKFGEYNDLSAKVKATYQLDSVGVYLYVKANDLLLGEDEKINMTIKPGVTFNIGAASCEIAAEFSDIGQEKVKLSVPFGVSLGF